MSQPILVAERITRDGKGLGSFTLTLDTARGLADGGQGVIVGNCPQDRMVRHIPHACRNALPACTLVACHSYEFASDLNDEASWQGTPMSSWLFESRFTLKPPNSRVLLTVPEKLYQLRRTARQRAYLPDLLFLVDPNGITIRRSSCEEFQGSRAQVVSKFRSACLAINHQTTPILWTSAPCGAFVHDRLCELMGVEAFLYLDGGTLRTASMNGLASSEEAGKRGHHTLDNDLTVAGAQGRRLLLVVGSTATQNENLVRQLGETRGYPILDAASVISQVRAEPSRIKDARFVSVLRSAITRELRRVNKRVVVLLGVADAVRRCGVHNTLWALSDNEVRTLLVVPSPLSWSTAEAMKAIEEIRATAPAVPLPAIVECTATGLANL